MTPRERKLQKIRLLEEKAARRARQSLAAYIRLAWPWIDSARYVHGMHIDAMCEHLEAVSAGDIQYLWINVPPGMMKSLTVSVFWPAWEWLARPNLQYQRASHDMALATRDNLKVRRLIMHPKHAELLGEIALRSDENGKTYFANVHGGSQRVVSPKSSTTGWRSHRLIVDDLLDGVDRHSELARTSANEWLGKTFLSRRHDEERDPVVIIAQRLHDDDVFGYINRELAHLHWERLILPQRLLGAPCVTSIWQDPRQQGELICPERVSDNQDRNNKITLGPADYAAQQAQDPAPEGGVIISPDKLVLYELSPLDVVAQEDAEVIISVDAAFKGKEESDCVCIQVWAKLKGVAHLIDEDLRVMTFTATLAAIKRMFDRWSPKAARGVTAVLIEDKANGSAIIDTMRSEIMCLVPVEPRGGKEARAHATQPAVEAGCVALYLHAEYQDPDEPGRSMNAQDKCARWGRFPRLRRDDDVDAMTQALIWWNTRAIYWWAWSAEAEEVAELPQPAPVEKQVEPLKVMTMAELLAQYQADA